ncbi:hypothetical protein GcC1_030036 [Golovinomyces cichoracearum]|uniref:Uncharacterized protein n=1 Tax=Golovinomyces cichoracearum TaxID=62708 RepID=A0A420J2J5_9PEZI|nr:hypothetical protein GcC1_030036 [Golovinomyces cichoracearum]
MSRDEKNFEGIEYKRTLLTNWTRLKFEFIVDDKKNFGKTISDCPKILVQKLSNMQHVLGKGLINDAFIHKKIVPACKI